VAAALSRAGDTPCAEPVGCAEFVNAAMQTMMIANRAKDENMWIPPSLFLKRALTSRLKPHCFFKVLVSMTPSKRHTSQTLHPNVIFATA
jgi:hypothetical protein